MATDPNTQDARTVAAKVISRWLNTAEFPDRLLPKSVANRAFLMELVYGIVRRRRSLQWILDQVLNRTPDRNLLPFLLMGTYQLIYMQGVADHAAIHETVEGVRRAQMKHATGFVNGVLRTIQRRKPALLQELEHQPLAVRESHPDELVQRWEVAFGLANTEALCQRNNQPPTVTICPNLLRCDTDQLLQLLIKNDVKARRHSFVASKCIEIPHGHRVTDLPGFSEGLFSVQDPATRVATDLLDVQPGMCVLDACASPGGKTAAIACYLQNQGELLAMDVHEDRVALLRSTLERLGLERVQVVRADGTNPKSMAAVLHEQTFDRILLDVPCTNTGVLQRRPDARWRFTLKRLEALLPVQRALLDTVSVRLKPNGILVYSTCSLEPEEGHDLVNTWLHESPAFELVSETTLVPPVSNTDGIFAAAIRHIPT